MVELGTIPQSWNQSKHSEVSIFSMLRMSYAAFFPILILAPVSQFQFYSCSWNESSDLHKKYHA